MVVKCFSFEFLGTQNTYNKKSTLNTPANKLHLLCFGDKLLTVEFLRQRRSISLKLLIHTANLSSRNIVQI